MSRGFRSFISGTARGSIVVAFIAIGCQGPDGDSAAAGDEVTVRGALSAGGVTSANLQLQVSKNACASNVAQNYFKVTNATTAAVPLSQIAIKYWINDTTTPSTNITPAVWYGGCVTSANGTCVHQMTGVTATAVRFAPACGPDASHQANWRSRSRRRTRRRSPPARPGTAPRPRRPSPTGPASTPARRPGTADARAASPTRATLTLPCI